METNKAYDIVAVGESLIDFVPAKKQEQGKLAFSGCPGGAPANVLACASKLGLGTAFIGKVGEDAFGKLLTDTLIQSKIDISGMIISKKYPTTLAFVTLDENGDRDFSFYRNQTADCMLTPEELDEAILSSTRIFHFGAVSMTKEPARSATIAAVKKAKDAGALISYDPNLREFLWDDLNEAREVIASMLAYADVVKLSDDELKFIAGTEQLEQGMRKLYETYSMDCLVVTMGKEGSMCLCGDVLVRHPSFSVKTLDTVGAGDTFWGSFLFQLLGGGFDIARPVEKELIAALDFANAAGALSTTKEGAIPAMPSKEEVYRLQSAAK